MINTIKQTVRFSGKLFLVLFFAFIIHLLVLKIGYQNSQTQLIYKTYLVNFLLAILIYFALILLKKRFIEILGFVFMAGSFLKFGAFFLIFYSAFKNDGVVTSFETTAFLIPYFLCLIVEVWYLSKILNQSF